MNVKYGRGGQAIARGQYQCYVHNSPNRACHSVNASYLDPPVLCAVLQTLAELTPQAVTEALAQEQQVHVQHQWQHAHVLQKAESAVTLAERRYKAVDPDNRLVR